MRFVGPLGGNNNTPSLLNHISPTDGSRLERVFSLIACHAQLLYPESKTEDNHYEQTVEHNRDEALLAIAGIVLLLGFGLLLWVCALSGPGHYTIEPATPAQYHVSQAAVSTPVMPDQLASAVIPDHQKDVAIMQPLSTTSSWQLDPDQAEVLAPFSAVNKNYYIEE